jgi:hypothetical protein
MWAWACALSPPQKREERASWDHKFAKASKAASSRGRRASFSVGLVEGVPVQMGLGGADAKMPDGTRLTVVDGVPVAVPAPEFAQQTPVGVVPNPQFFVTDDV